MIVICSFIARTQSFPEGIPFQAQIYSQSGGILSNATVGVRINIRSVSLAGAIEWQEDHTVALNDLGHFSIVIGSGVSTGAGLTSTFDNLLWGVEDHFLEVLVDENNTGTYVSILNHQLMSVPYAYHSKTTSQKYALAELTDVDTAGIEIGDVLKWNGTMWVPEPDLISDCDTVNFAFSAEHSNYADTATYAENCVTIMYVDTANYSFVADSADFSNTAGFSAYSDTASYAYNAGVAQYSIGNWGLNGNAGTIPATQFLGTTDSIDLVFKSYNSEKLRIKANGRFGFNTSNPLTDFHVTNVNGVLLSGTHGVGQIPTTGAGSRMMWYPKKSAFRAGYVSGVNWDDANIGNYSFAVGYNTRASGLYSAAFGFSTTASGEGSFAVGNLSIASGYYSFAAGHNPSATGDHSIALGRGAIANAYGSIAIGYHPQVDAQHGLALGNYVYVSGQNSVGMGYHSHVNHPGSFVYSDESAPLANTFSNAPNQFMVKASGGFIFYTNSTLTTGVVLPAGAGAWSTLSDRNSKDNITEIDPQYYLNKLDSINVYSWNYISQDSSIVHIGPMAQDFYQTFEIGTDSTRINSGDFDGVNLILLKALHSKVEELENQNAEVERLRMELAALKEEREKMYALLLKLEQLILEEQSTSNQ